MRSWSRNGCTHEFDSRGGYSARSWALRRWACDLQNVLAPPRRSEAQQLSTQGRRPPIGRSDPGPITRAGVVSLQARVRGASGGLPTRRGGWVTPACHHAQWQSRMGGAIFRSARSRSRHGPETSCSRLERRSGSHSFPRKFSPAIPVNLALLCVRCETAVTRRRSV
jgi:hypothetical protein